MTGFVPCGDMPEEGGDDEDGSLRPPLRAPARGGGVQTSPRQLGRVPMELWSSDKDSQQSVGLLCMHDVVKRIFYARLEAPPTAGGGRGGEIDEGGEATKGAITTLLDVAEACNTRKITLGLGPEHAGNAELICSLLYLGFQVVPSRKSPLANTVLLLDFDIGPAAGGLLVSDHTCTGTSECSTSADDDETPLDSEALCESD